MDYPRPISTVDIVLLTLEDAALKVALYPREGPPFQDMPALPGGFVRVDQDADLEGVARRVLQEKATLKGLHLEQLATFSGRDRDPRGWSLSVVYLALLPVARLRRASTDALLRPAEPVPAGLPFDHGTILAAAVARVRAKSVYSTLPTFLLDDEFTITELRDVYRCVFGVDKLDLAGFRKKILDLRAIEPIAGHFRTGTHRPAQLYRRAARGIAHFDRTI